MKQTFTHRPPTLGVHLLNDPNPDWLSEETRPAPLRSFRLKKTRPTPQKSDRQISRKSRAS